MATILRGVLPANQKAGLNAANDPSADNPFVTGTDVVQFDERLDMLEKPRIVVIETNGTRTEIDAFSATKATGPLGSTIQVYGQHLYGPNRIAELGQGVTLHLMPGSHLQLKEMYVATNNLDLSKPMTNAIIGPGKLSCDLSYGDGIRDLLLDGVDFKGSFVLYAFGVSRSTPRKLRVYNSTLSAGAGSVLDCNYGYGGNYFLYAETEFISNRISSTAAKIFNFHDDLNSGVNDVVAAEKNILRLLNNLITAPADSVVADDSKGAFSYQGGTNYYLGGVQPPTKARDPRLVVECACEGSTVAMRGGTPPPAPNDLLVDEQGYGTFTPASGTTATDYEREFTAQ